jgi:hypothetical protein
MAKFKLKLQKHYTCLDLCFVRAMAPYRTPNYIPEFLINIIDLYVRSVDLLFKSGLSYILYFVKYKPSEIRRACFRRKGDVGCNIVTMYTKSEIPFHRLMQYMRGTYTVALYIYFTEMRCILIVKLWIH